MWLTHFFSSSIRSQFVFLLLEAKINANMVLNMILYNVHHGLFLSGLHNIFKTHFNAFIYLFTLWYQDLNSRPTPGATPPALFL
jgi:Ni/Fe-hydrogenase subunit HybB-like protein